MLREVFSEKELQKMAVASGFYKRKCDFTPAMFFDILLYCASQTEANSLSQVSAKVKKQYRVRITRQSIDERFREEAVAFVKGILKRLLERQLSKVFCHDFLSQYNQVRIKDSTRFNVPDNLSDHFKGSGGNKGTSQAGVSVQYEYDARSGKVLDLNITPGIRNDATDAWETKGKIEKGDLFIRDLGYFNLSVLTGFAEQRASFVSRLNTSTLVFDPDTKAPIGFKELYESMCQKKQTRCDRLVLVGKGQQKLLRLIIDMVPDHVYEERVRKANKESKKKGWTMSDGYKARCRFNLFITNVPVDELSAEEAMLVYRLRWQVELTFKNWKSVCKINNIQKMKYERFACLLFAKLILILLNTQVICNLQAHCFKKWGKLLSEKKCFKTLRESFGILRDVWKAKQKVSEKKFRDLVRQFWENHWKDKRKNKVNLIEIIELFVCKSKDYAYIDGIKKGTKSQPRPLITN
jgi:hypothetical protein